MANPIDGVHLGVLDEHRDHRGSFTEVFADHWPTGVAPTQWSVVRSHAGVLRGMHLHLRHDEFVSVVSGVLWVGLHDLRPSSPTYGASQLIRLDADEPAYLAFPRGLVHGWIAEAAAVHLQAVSESYVDYGDDDNLGCRWDDPELGLDWPVEPQITSARSDAFGSLSGLRAAVAASGEPLASGPAAAR